MLALRLRYGMRWQGKYPTVSMKTIARILLFVAALHVVSAVTEVVVTRQLVQAAVISDLRAHFAEKAAEYYEASARVLKRCEEKRIVGYYYTDGRAFECPRGL